MIPEVSDVDNVYIVKVEDIPAAELSKRHVFTVTDGTDTKTYNASALSYAYERILNSKDQNMVNLCKALYLYSQAAEKYFGL